MSENPDPIESMNESELRAQIIVMRKSMTEFIGNYNDNIDVMLNMEEQIIALDAENEKQQMVEQSLITTIAVLSEGIL